MDSDDSRSICSTMTVGKSSAMPVRDVPSIMACSEKVAEIPLEQTMKVRVLSSQRFELSSSRKQAVRSLVVSGDASSR